MELQRFLVEHGYLAAAAVAAGGGWLLWWAIRGLREGRAAWRSGLAGAIGLLIAAAGIYGTRAAWSIHRDMAPTFERIDAAAGEPAPPLSFTVFPEGEQRSLADYRGELVILNFWAEWCVPCHPELEALSRVRTAWADSGVEVIAANRSPPDVVTDYFEERPRNLVQAQVDTAGSLPEPWRMIDRVLPSTFFIAPDGTVLEGHVGRRPESFFHERLREHLGPS